MPVRSAKSKWDGTIIGGNGRVMFAGFDQPYTFSSRFQSGAGTNPEELIGAALASCFSMAFAEDLERAGKIPKTVNTTAEVSIDPKQGGGWSITGIKLKTEATVPGMDKATFQKTAEGTKENCPVSRALKAVPITLEAKLLA